jgi:hypothetical protein
MKILNTTLIINLLQSDLIKTGLSYPIYLKLINQFIKVLTYKPNLPLYFICNNKQYKILFKKYVENKNLNIYFLTLKESLSIKTVGIFFLINIEDDNLIIKKLLASSLSLIIVINENLSKTQSDFYKLPANFNNLKHIVFFIALMNKIKNYAYIT